MGKGHIDLEHFARHALAPLFRRILDCTKGTGAFGKLDQRDTHIIDQREQHLAYVFHLIICLAENAGTGGVSLIDGCHAQHALDKLRHFIAELFPQGVKSDTRLPHTAIQNRGNECFTVESQFHENLGHLETRQIAVAPSPHRIACPRALLHFPAELAGTPDTFMVIESATRLQRGDPLFKADTAIGIELVTFTYLNHGATPILNRTFRTWRAQTRQWTRHARYVETCP